MGLAQIESLVAGMFNVAGISVSTAVDRDVASKSISREDVVVPVVINDRQAILGREVPIVAGVDIVEVFAKSLSIHKNAVPTVVVAGEVRYGKEILQNRLSSRADSIGGNDIAVKLLRI